MNLPPKIVRQIERGEKTQHRVYIKKPTYVERPGPRGTTRTGDDSYYLRQPRKPQIGDSIVIAPRREPDPERNLPETPEVRISVTADVETQRLGEMTSDQARAEGYRGNHPLADFAHDWMDRHDPRYPPLVEKLCPNCLGEKSYENGEGEQVECDEPGCDEVGTVMAPERPDTDTIIEWFTRRHGNHLVHVITFELQTDVTRFLNRRQYMPPTSSITEALDSTAPILDPPRPDWKHRAEVRRREALRDRDGSRLAGLRSEEERLAALKSMAQEANVDITSDVRVIGRRLDAIETKITNKTQRAA